MKVSIDKYILRQLYVSTISNFTSFFVGVIFSFSTGVLEQIEITRKLGTSQYSSIGSSGFVLTFVGSLINTVLIDRIGRKGTLFVVYLSHSIGWCILTLSDEYFTLGRIVLSFAIGVGTCSLVFIAEMCDPKYRGTFSLMSGVTEAFGTMFVNILTVYIPWHMCSLCLAMLSFLLFVGVLFIPDTPYWYMLKNDRQNAERSLLWIRGNKGSTESELNEINLHIHQNQNKKSGTCNLLMSGAVWKPFLLFTFYILLVELTGFDMILPYTTQFFSKLNKTSVNNNIFTIALSIVGLFGSIFSVYVIDKVDRRVLLKSAATTMGALTALAALLQTTDLVNEVLSSWISIVAILCTGFLGQISIFCLPWLVISETLSNEVRGIVYPMLMTECYIIIFVCVHLFPLVLSSLPTLFILWTFALAYFFSTGYVHFFIRETKGISLMGVRQ